MSVQQVWKGCAVEACLCVTYVPSKEDKDVCQCTHKRCFHNSETITSNPLSLAGSLPAPSPRPAGSDITNQVSKVFEGEVNKHLDDHFQSALPGCTILNFKNREIEDDMVHLELDSFAYMTKDTRCEGHTNNDLGIQVVVPPNILKKKAVAAPSDNLKRSPGAIASNLQNKADKYIIGESYSGEQESKVRAKVGALEEKISKMMYRTQRLSGRSINDVTSLFGAGILSYVCPMGVKRLKHANNCKQQILQEISKKKTPHLWRLAEARRLFLCVLSSTEGAHTTSLRAIFSGINSLSLDIMEILNYLKPRDTSAKDEEEHDYGK